MKIVTRFAAENKIRQLGEPYFVYYSKYLYKELWCYNQYQQLSNLKGPSGVHHTGKFWRIKRKLIQSMQCKK